MFLSGTSGVSVCVCVTVVPLPAGPRDQQHSA